jgi:hypothetical protein
MHSPSDSSRRRLGAVLLLPLCLLAACEGRETQRPANSEQGTGEGPTAGPVETLADAELPGWSRELLQLAFDSASKMPLEPHIKNRSRFQYRVVTAALDLDQAKTALRFAKEIANWQQGEALADLAIHTLENGRRIDVEGWLKSAKDAARRQMEGKDAQTWRSSRILAKVARVRLMQGRDAEAAAFIAQLDRSELEYVEPELMARSEKGDFDKILAQIEQIASAADLDLIKSAFRGLVRLYERDFADEKRRARIEELLRTGFGKIPLDLRIGLLLEIAEISAKKGDREGGRRILAAAEGFRTERPFVPESDVMLRAQFAAVRHLLGQEKLARQQLDASLAAFEAGRKRIINMYRGDALRPLAEAWARVGDRDKALQIYQLVCTESLENPNSRPRVRDLVATCASLVRVGLEPSEELSKQLRSIAKGLKSPW